MAVRNVTVTMPVSDGEREALERLYVGAETDDPDREPLRITEIRDVFVGGHGAVVQVTIADPRGSAIASDGLEQRLRQRMAEVTSGIADAD